MIRALAALFWLFVTPALAATPVLADYAMSRGALTLSASGGVPLTLKDAPAVVAPSGLAPTAWTMQTSGETPTACSVTLTGGTVGHWNLPSDCGSPTPTAAGHTASLNGGPYTFSVTATGPSGTSVAKTLTINITANTYTVSTPTQVSANSTAGLKGIASSLGGKTVALARWSEAAFNGNALVPLKGGSFTAADLSKSLTFSGFVPSSGRITVTSEDTSNRTTVSRIVVTGGGKIDVTALNVHSYLAQYIPSPSDCTGTTPPTCDQHNTTQSQALLFVNGSVTQGWPDDVSFIDMDVGAPTWASDTTQWFQGMRTAGNQVSPFQKIGHLHVSNVRFFQAEDGLAVGDTTNGLFENITIDTIAANFIFIGGKGSTTTTFQDIIEVRPFFHVTKPNDHYDFLQMGNVTNISPNGMTFRRIVLSIANGNEPGAHGTFIDNYKFSGFSTDTITLQDIFSEGVSAVGMTVDAGSGWNVQWNTSVRGQAPSVASGFLVPTMDYSPGGTLSGVFAANFVQLTTTDLTNAFIASGLPAFNTTNYVMGEHFTPPPWSDTNNDQAQRCAYYAQVFANPCAVINYAALTPTQIAAALASAYAPIVHGALWNSANGTYVGAYFPDGTWNNGTSYGAVATAITSFASLPAAQVGQPVVITFQLNGGAPADTIITPAVSGVSGTFAPATVTILSGGAVGSVSFTGSTAGAASITATNNQALTNPAALPVTISADPTPPTSYTQIVSAAAIALGDAADITYTLNHPAALAVTITPGLTGVSGSFSPPTALIPFGQTVGAVSFFPTNVGTASLSATNDNSLANPMAATLPVYPASVSPGGFMRGLGH